MKLKDLIFNREKLRKYDELKEWKERFEDTFIQVVKLGLSAPIWPNNIVEMPDDIRALIIRSIDAEIAKLDEE